MILVGEIWNVQTPKEQVPESLSGEKLSGKVTASRRGSGEFLVTENTKGDAVTANLSGSRTEEVRCAFPLSFFVLFKLITSW